MAVNPTLYCPIRGQLNIKAKTKDGLKFTEEKRRIDCIKYLLSKGYPAAQIKTEGIVLQFGHKGRNAFRVDVVVSDIAIAEFGKLDVEQRREHAIVLAEIKRDNQDAPLAKETQVKAALGFLPNMKALGIYWDDLEQKVFYRQIQGDKQNIIEAAITYLPDYGGSVKLSKFRYDNLKPSQSLSGLFRRLDDILHHYCMDKPIRFQILMQVLLAKIYDEESHKAKNQELAIQDFKVFSLSDAEVSDTFNTTLRKSLGVYQSYLPDEVPNRIRVPGAALRQISELLSPLNILGSGPEVIQEFYMYFAKELYKWDLAQYFTPYEVVDFIVRIANPRYGNTIKDPACGSADFLISAFRRGLPHDSKMGDKIWGADNSQQAVQISVLNMVLNGDGKSNIKQEDSLVEVNNYKDRYSIMLCNPPFGVKIQEHRKDVLKNFDLGKDLTSQETGILFAELCVKQAKADGGRVAIILPNGYLGNRSEKYLSLRKWILRHARVAAIIGFPRFTFKKAGADVSASVLVMERRKTPLDNPADTEDYPVYVNLLQSVGWDIGNKVAKKVYKRDPANGAFVFSSDNEPILEADFEDILADLYASPTVDAFPWIAEGVDGAGASSGWSVSAKTVCGSPELILDPKRLCRKYLELLEELKSKDHISLLGICDLVAPKAFKREKAKIYRYVELDDIHQSSLDSKELRGWELPDRAKHQADQGDIFIGSIWGSVGKWFMAGAEAKEGNFVVTNGCHRLKVKDDMKQYLPDLLYALSAEFYRVQMRALATGSDGLAQVSEPDLKLILIPKLTDASLHAQMAAYAVECRERQTSIHSLVRQTVGQTFSSLDVKPRRWHFSQV